MLPAAVAIAMVGVIGAFGSGVRTAYAIPGDICEVAVGNGGAIEATEDFDGQGNDVYVVDPDVNYGLVFRLESDDLFDMPNVTIRTDSETGAARIFSQAEIVEVDGGAQHVDHVLIGGNGVGTQVVDTIDPDWDDGQAQYFTDPDGNPVDGINGWLEDVAGQTGFTPWGTDTANDIDVCGDNTEDPWGYIDFECIEAGYFHIDIETPDDTEETGWTGKFFCGGQADTAEIKSQRSTLETHPTGVAPNGFGTSIITVTVFDQFGDRIDGVEVTLTTDNCTFTDDGGDDIPGGTNPISPAGGGKTVTVYTDTDSDDDVDFLADHPLEHSAGTAEAILDCGTPGPTGTPGIAHITAVVDRPGSDLVLHTDVTVVGQTAATGLTLTLTPDDIECGETIKATAKAVDANGAPVSNGTVVLFTTDTSSGVIGGNEGAQGEASTVGGEASVLIATDPGNPGVHTVIAFVMNAAGTPSAQASDTYTCDAAVAPAAPTVAPPSTGTGTITPPSTGDAGLAAGSTSSSLFVIIGAVAFVLAGLASVRFARN